MDIQTLDINGNPAPNHMLLTTSTESMPLARVRKISPISLITSSANPSASAQKPPQSPSHKSKKSKTTRKIGKLLRTLTDYQLLATSVDESSPPQNEEGKNSDTFTTPVINLMSSANKSSSDMDICGQTSEYRFPWLVDASTQYYPSNQDQTTPKSEAKLKSTVHRKPTPAHVRSSSLL